MFTHEESVKINATSSDLTEKEKESRLFAAIDLLLSERDKKPDANDY